MIKFLEQALDKLKQLPEEEQHLVADVIEHLAAKDPEPFVVPDAHRAAILEGLAQADRGDFASDEAVDLLLRRRWD